MGEEHRTKYKAASGKRPIEHPISALFLHQISALFLRVN
jgi:hypothetical protein